MKQKFALILATVCLVLSMSTESYAAEGRKEINGEVNEASGGIEPYYLNISNIAVGLKIDGNTAQCRAEVFAKNVCSVKVTMCLQRKENGSWVNKISWSGSSTSGVKTMTYPYTLFEKGSYRVKVYATVGGEEVTCTSDVKTY